MKTLAINDFVKRQTKNSRFSYFDGTWDELLQLVKYNFDNQEQGYRDGVILIKVPSDRFYTSICKIDKDSILESKFEARREGEEPVKRTVIKNGTKTLAQYVKVVLYRHDVLLENNENSTNADWEIISINASIVENEPMHPMTMARNMLHKEGGTKGEYTGQQFAEALWFWKDYILYEGDESSNE
jgi:hypothetical protein